ADPRPDLHEDDVRVPGSDSRAPLSEGHHVDVVVHPHRRAVPGRESLANRVAVPAGHDRWGHRSRRPELHRSRNADADAPQGPRIALEKLVEMRLDEAEDGVWALADVAWFCPMREHRASKIGEGDVSAGCSEIGHEKATGSGIQDQL